MSPFWVVEKSRAANHIFIQTFPFCTMWRRINCKNNPLSLQCWLKKVSLETELNPAENIRAGHTTTLPRQRDHVFRRKYQSWARDNTAATAWSCFQEKNIVIIALLHISTFVRATPPRPQHFSNSITVALSLSQSWTIVAGPALRIT